MKERFIGEPIIVNAASVRASGLAAGQPVCPGRFTWQGREHVVVEVLGESRRISKGYVRAHRFRVRTDSGMVATLSCDRHIPHGGNPWRLYTIEQNGSYEDGDSREENGSR